MGYASGEDAVNVSRPSHASGEKAEERKARFFLSLDIVTDLRIPLST
jgi:hypothetical protein